LFPPSGIAKRVENRDQSREPADFVLFPGIRLPPFARAPARKKEQKSRRCDEQQVLFPDVWPEPFARARARTEERDDETIESNNPCF
jgi:hypothetical protein